MILLLSLVLLMYRQGSLNLPDALKDIYLIQQLVLIFYHPSFTTLPCVSFNLLLPTIKFSCATKPCSVSKLREMTGSGIFAANGENGESETDSSLSNPDNKTALRMYQVSFLD